MARGYITARTSLIYLPAVCERAVFILPPAYKSAARFIRPPMRRISRKRLIRKKCGRSTGDAIQIRAIAYWRTRLALIPISTNDLIQLSDRMEEACERLIWKYSFCKNISENVPLVRVPIQNLNDQYYRLYVAVP